MKKKVFATFLLIIFCLVSVFTFPGCSLIKKLTEKKSYVYLTFVWSEDNSVVYELTRELGRAWNINIEVPGRTTGYYKVKIRELHGDFEYNNTKTCTPTIGEKSTINLIYSMEGHPYYYNVRVNVHFIEYRITPTIVLDPNGAIEYTENERYVYKYDGEYHHPTLAYCAYDDKKLGASEYELYISHNFTSARRLKEVGVYRVGLLVKNEQYTNLTIARHFFTDTRVFFTIEIIE